MQKLSLSDLHRYQMDAVRFILERKRCQLFAFLGSGKTIITLTALSLIRPHKILIIAPLRVAQSVWQKEAERWEHTSKFRFATCLGRENDRVAALSSDADIYTINRENVPWLVEYYGRRWPFKTVVVDESSSFKNASSKGFKSLRKVMPLTQCYVGLTGTPISNGYLNLWSQCFLVDRGVALGKTMSAYKQRYFYPDYHGYTFTLRDGEDKAIQSAIADYTLCINNDGLIDMPRILYQDLFAVMPISKQKFYNEFKSRLIAEIDSSELTALTAAVLANKLLQCANGAIYDENRNVVFIHDEKIEVLKELIDSNEGESILVAYNYKHDLDRLKNAFPHGRELDSKQSMNEWNEGKIPLMFIHPASSGHGLNLQSGGRVVVWFGLNWSLELYQQLNGRLYRQGQTRNVIVYHIICDNTIDVRLVDVLGKKDSVQRDLLDALKNNCLL